MTRVGITGHRYFTEGSLPRLRNALERWLDGIDGPLEAVTCLAVGADQLLAEAVLKRGGTVTFVKPCRRIAETYDAAELPDYERLAGLARVIELDFEEPDAAAFEAAGTAILDHSDKLVAIWDGKPAVDKGGTGGVVEAARERGIDVTVIWPEGVARA